MNLIYKKFLVVQYVIEVLKASLVYMLQWIEKRQLWHIHI